MRVYCPPISAGVETPMAAGVEAPVGAAVEASVGSAAASMPASGGGASGLQIQRQGLPPKMLRFMEPMLFLCFSAVFLLPLLPCCCSLLLAAVLLPCTAAVLRLLEVFALVLSGWVDPVVSAGMHVHCTGAD